MFTEDREYNPITEIELLDEFRKKFPDIEISENFVEFAIIARFYSIKSLPLCGKLQWMRIDYERYCKNGTCRPVRLYHHYIALEYAEAVERAKRNREAHKPSHTDGPDYRGPNGTWSLD